MKRVIVAMATLFAVAATANAASLTGVWLADPAPYVAGSQQGAATIIGGQASTDATGYAILQMTVQNRTAFTYHATWTFTASDPGVVYAPRVCVRKKIGWRWFTTCKGANANVNLGDNPVGIAPANPYSSADGSWYPAMNVQIPLDGQPHSITVSENGVPIERYDLVVG